MYCPLYVAVISMYGTLCSCCIVNEQCVHACAHMCVCVCNTRKRWKRNSNTCTIVFFPSPSSCFSIIRTSVMRHSGAKVTLSRTSSPPVSRLPLWPTISVNRLSHGISSSLSEDKPENKLWIFQSEKLIMSWDTFHSLLQPGQTRRAWCSECICVLCMCLELMFVHCAFRKL